MKYPIQAICPETLRRVLLVAHPPNDQPGREQALRGASRALIALAEQLPNPDAILTELVDEFRVLAGPLSDHSDVLGRRLAAFPAWRLLLSLTERTHCDVLAAIGAAIALAYIAGKKIPRSHANTLRKAATQSDAGARHALVQTLLLRGDLRFSVGAVAPPPASQFEQIHALYRARFRYLGEHAQQARTSHRSLEAGVFCAAMGALRARVEAGCAVAILQASCICSGLGLELTRTLPLVGRHPGEWSAALDIEHGTLSLDLDAVGQGARAARAGAIPASRILVRPLPSFLHAALHRLGGQRPGAITLDEQIAHPEVTERDLVDGAAHPQRLRPSLARAANTVEAYAVREAGVHRVTAAYLTARLETIPHSKRYYALISRETLWEGAHALFRQIGWGDPVPLVLGLPAGAQAVPMDGAILEWTAWMGGELAILAPGRNAGQLRLVAHHNAFCRAAASLVAFCLALRPVREIPLWADAPFDGLTVDVLDKRSPSAWAPDGRSAGPHPTPFVRLARYQIEAYRKHCSALARRLRRFDTLTGACRHLEAIAAASPVPLFITLDDEGCPRAIGTHDLTAWWPDSLHLADNWWRAFWQTRLAERAVPSRAIDRLMRHVTAGERPMSSDSGDSPLTATRQVLEAMNREISRLGIEPYRGLVR